MSVTHTEPNKRSQPGVVKLRAGVVIQRADHRQFLVCNGTTGEYYQLGIEERHLLHLLHDCPSVDEVVLLHRDRFGHIAKRDVLEFVEQLRGLQLLDAPAETLTDGQLQSCDIGPERPDRDPSQFWNSLFDCCLVLFGWLLSPLMVGVVLLLIIIGVNVLVRNWGELRVETYLIWRDRHWVTLFAVVYCRVLLLISLPSALLTAMATRYCGGRIRSFGLSLWQDVLPLFRADTGDSLILLDANHRRKVMFADLLYPLALLGCSLTMWAMCSSGLRTFWLLVIPTALIASVVRCNIFSDTSGYFLLCDVTNQWRIRERAQAETRSWLTLHTSPLPLSPKERDWLRIYGLGFFVYRVLRDALLVIGGGYLLTSWLGGLGALIFLMLIVWRWRAPLMKVISFVVCL